MRTHARVVVIGGGAVGCSLLYHLAKRGWTDTVLLEKHDLTAGSTWHAAGLCTQFNASINVTSLLMYGVDLFRRLEADTGQTVDFHGVGSIRLATTQERMDQYRDQAGLAKIVGLPYELIGPAEIARRAPLVNVDGVIAGAWTPTDGYVDPSSITRAMARGARDLGAEIELETPVTELRPQPGGEWDVVTPRGTIRAGIVVNAGGIWGREIGQLAGVELPIVPMEHQYLITDAVPELLAEHAEMPVVRDTEASFYVREEASGLIVGPYEHDPKPWAARGIPREFGQQLLAPDFEQVGDVLDLAQHRLPVLQTAGMKQLLNGPTSYTPDGNALMGWVPGLRNLFALTGFSYGIVQSGGAGYNAAAWIIDGQPVDNLWELDVARFGPYASALPFVIDRAREVYEREYAIPYPFEELPAGRPLKTDPLYDRLLARGAVMGARNGWERPLYFVPEGQPTGDRPTYHRPDWLPYQVAECAAVRERAGLLDMTSFAKYEVRGPGAAALLDRLGANRLPRVGRAALVQMLTPAGGIWCDVTVSRLAEDRFYLITAAGTETHDLDWIVAACAGRRFGGPGERHRGLGRARDRGTARARRPRGRDRRRPLERGLPVHGRARHPPRPGAGAGAPRHVHGRAGLGAPPPDRGFADPVRPAARGRRGARPGRHRVPGARLAAAREGLPAVGRGHLGAVHAARGRPGAVRRARQGRVHRA